MGAQAAGAVFDAIVCIREVAATAVTQGIQGAITEHATKGFRVCTGVAGKVVTVTVLKKIIWHIETFLLWVLFNQEILWYNDQRTVQG